MIDEGSARAKRCSSTFLASRRTFSFQGTVQDLDFNDTVGGLIRVSCRTAHRASRIARACASDSSMRGGAPLAAIAARAALLLLSLVGA